MAEPANAPATADKQAASLNEVDLAGLTKDQLLDPSFDPAAADNSTEGEDAVEESAEADDSSEEESGSEPGSESEEASEDAEEGDEEEEDGEEDDSTVDEDSLDDEAASATVDYTPDQIQELYKNHRRLLSLKGRQGNALHDKDNEIAELHNRLTKLEGKGDEDSGEEIPKTKEEWEALFTTDPLKANDLYFKMRQGEADRTAEQSRVAEATEIVTVTPEVGAEIFKKNNAIENFDKWSESKEGNAVQEYIRQDEDLALTMLAAINTGNAKAVARVLTRGLKAVREGAVEKKAGKVARGQVREAEKAKPRSVPRPGRQNHPPAKKGLHDMTPAEIANLSDREFVRLTGGRI